MVKYSLYVELKICIHIIQRNLGNLTSTVQKKRVTSSASLVEHITWNDVEVTEFVCFGGV